MDRRVRLLIMAGVVLAAAAWAGGVGGGALAPAPGSTAAPPGAAQAAVVVHVIDGDTVRVAVTGGQRGALPAGEHRVRLLGVDAPEVARDGRAGECGGAESTAFLRSLLASGTRVWLRADREDRDRYGRPLRYLWTDEDRFVNRTVVAAGHGRALRVDPNDRHWERLRGDEAHARARGAGLWGRCRR